MDIPLTAAAFSLNGALRAAINLGNPILAPLELMCFDTAAQAVAAVTQERADTGFFAVDPWRGGSGVLGTVHRRHEGQRLGGPGLGPPRHPGRVGGAGGLLTGSFRSAFNQPTVHMQHHTILWLLGSLAFATSAALAAGKAHEHGALKLDVAIEGNKLTIEMQAPLDNLLGFERAPRTDVERKAAADVLSRLRGLDKAAPLFVTDAAAQCSLSAAEVQAPVLEPRAKPATKIEHADLDARYEFSCAKAGELRSLDVGLFGAYPRIQRIDVQVAGPKGQSKVTLKRPARRVKLVL